MPWMGFCKIFVYLSSHCPIDAPSQAIYNHGCKNVDPKNRKRLKRVFWKKIETSKSVEYKTLLTN